MSIESDAQSDLALNDEDAENVLGGKAVGKKSHKDHRHHPSPADQSSMVVMPPLGGSTDFGDGPDPTISELDPNS